MHSRVSDILQKANVVSHCTKLVVHRRNVEFRPEDRSVATLTFELHTLVAAIDEGRSKMIDARLGGFRVAQKADIQAVDFLCGVAGESLEGRIHVDDRQYLGGIVHHEYRIAACFERTPK